MSEKVETWTEERLLQLTTLWSEGRSASAIAKVLGLTRNAVIGKAHRMNLEKPKVERAPIQAILEARREQPDRVEVGIPISKIFNTERMRVRRGSVAILKPKPEPKPQPAPVIALFPSRNLSILEVGPGECRFTDPEADGYAACGRPTGGGSWCKQCEPRVFYRGPSRRIA